MKWFLIHHGWGAGGNHQLLDNLTLDPELIQPHATATTDYKPEPTTDPAHEPMPATKPEPEYMMDAILVQEPEPIAESDQVREPVLTSVSQGMLVSFIGQNPVDPKGLRDEA